MENDQYLALFVGNNWRLKGAHEALEALARLTAKGDRRAVIMMVGADDPDEPDRSSVLTAPCATAMKSFG